jgi:hypothetical protein
MEWCYLAPSDVTTEEGPNSCFNLSDCRIDSLVLPSKKGLSKVADHDAMGLLSVRRPTDEFLITYACIGHLGWRAGFFNLGHSVELYLKAAMRKAQPNIDVSRYGHDIERLLRDVQAAAPPLLSNYVLRKSAADKYLLNPTGATNFRIDPDYDHYHHHMELYWISRYLMDTKYVCVAQEN